jgi:hypothetical protein
VIELDRLVDGLAESLESAGLEYAFGGALALAYWAPPRATADIDLNLFVDVQALDSAFAAIETAGFVVKRDEATRWAAERGDFRAFAGPVRLDVFLSFSPFHDEVRERAVRRPSASGRAIRVLSAEDLMLFKLLFDRPKDWLDMEKIVQQQGASLDSGYLARWSRELMPEGDGRAARLQALLDAHR